MQASKILWTVITAALLYITPITASTDPRRISYTELEQRIRYQVELLLAEQYCCSTQLPDGWFESYKSTCNTIINETTRKLDDLLSNIDKYVSDCYLDQYVMMLVSERLQQNGIYNVPSNMSSECQQKCLNAMSKVRSNASWWNSSTNYYQKTDVQRCVDSEFDSWFLNKLKNPSSTTSVLGDVISLIWSAIKPNQPAPATPVVNVTMISPNAANNAGAPAAASAQPAYIYYNNPCSMCNQYYYGEERVGALSCGHTFHAECAKNYLAQSKTCPRCGKTNVYLAKIYDSKEKVPGYVATAQPQAAEQLPTYAQVMEAAPANMVIYFNNPCAVCQEYYFGEERIAALDCGHTFHPECIRQWLSAANNPQKTCPLCRHPKAYVAKIYDKKEDVPGYTR